MRRATGLSSFPSCFWANAEISTVQAKRFPDLGEGFAAATPLPRAPRQRNVFVVLQVAQHGFAHDSTLVAAARDDELGNAFFQFLFQPDCQHRCLLQKCNTLYYTMRPEFKGEGAVKGRSS